MFGFLQKRQESRAQKIALFDKRYDIYKSFADIFEIMKYALIKDDMVTIPNYLVVANMVLESYKLIPDKDFLVEHLSLSRVAQQASKDESQQADRDLFYLDWYAHNQLLQLHSKLLAQIKPAKFCFNERIYNTLERTVEEFFNYILIFRGGSGDEKERDTILLNKYINLIKEAFAKHHALANLNLTHITILFYDTDGKM